MSVSPYFTFPGTQARLAAEARKLRDTRREVMSWLENVLQRDASDARRHDVAHQQAALRRVATKQASRVFRDDAVITAMGDLT